MSNLGYRIQRRRKQLGMTQEELARKMGYKSKSTINKIELGINDIPQSKVAKFAEVLDTSIAYIAGWEEEKPTANYDGLTEGQKKLIALCDGLSDDQIDLIIQIAKTILGRVQ